MELPILVPMAQTLQELARTQIKQWISSTGITQTDLASRMNRNQAWMSRYLSGDIDADLDTLHQMAQVFGHTIASLVNMPTDPEEAALIKAYRGLRPETRPLILQILQEFGRPRRGGRRGRTRR